MRKILFILFSFPLFFFSNAQVNYCDSIEILITNQSLNSITCTTHTSGMNTFWTTQDWTLTDKYGNVVGTTSGNSPTFNMPNPMNSDTNYICITSLLSSPALTVVCNTCDTLVWNGTSWMLLSMMPNPCNLNGASVYIDNSSMNRMMNASVNGMSMYSYSWTDTNGLVVGTANQIPFYTQWCVTVTDNITGCDTTICQDCIADVNAMCMCIMIYMPVCGCDGVMYANSCLADCADVPWTPATPNGMPGGFLPCSQPSICEVEIDGDSIICNWGTPHILEASPSANSNPFVSYVWSTGQTGHLLTITTPGTYCVIATDSTGCTDSACFTVSIQDIPIYTFPSPPEICVGDSIVLEIDTFGLSNIMWVPNSLPTPPVHRIVDFPLPPSQTYVVEAIDLAGCERRGEVFVEVDNCTNCEVEIDGDSIICNWGSPHILEASPSANSNPFVSYIWSTGQTGHILTVNSPGTYCVVATDSTGCSDSACFTVSVQEIEIYTVPSPPIICLGDSIVMEIDPALNDIVWTTGDTLDRV
ncbi:MAG: Kazal-type serine protease inhibitor, partial [Bacteroidota bacterium]|nr:Kazal-type serine protease inhibitor [Bacteroidota bacterium]